MCSTPPAAPQGTSFENCSSTQAGETCGGTCTEGYAGQPVATCGGDGQWTSDGTTFCQSLGGECHSGSNASTNTPVLLHCHPYLAVHCKANFINSSRCAAVYHGLQVQPAPAIPLHLKALCLIAARQNLGNFVRAGAGMVGALFQQSGSRQRCASLIAHGALLPSRVSKLPGAEPGRAWMEEWACDRASSCFPPVGVRRRSMHACMLMHKPAGGVRFQRTVCPHRRVRALVGPQ